MNKSKMIELLEDGAYFDSRADKFFHPSFRQGFRTVHFCDISWVAVKNTHGVWGTNRLQRDEKGVYRLIPIAVAA